jgi:hypothetical protein
MSVTIVARREREYNAATQGESNEQSNAAIPDNTVSSARGTQQEEDEESGGSMRTKKNTFAICVLV